MAHMARGRRTVSTAILISIIISSLPPISADSRQGIDYSEAFKECEGQTFEWMFVYTHGIFTMNLGTFDNTTSEWEWKDGNSRADAWVNDTLAPVLRADVDELVSNITMTFGDADAHDDHLGTDEVSLLTDAGPECLEQISTRVGLTSPWSNGLDSWNNVSWKGKESMVIQQENGVPAGPDGEYNTGDEPSETKECDGPTKSNCWEYPTTIVGEDVYLNMTGDLSWNGITNPKNFTILMNGTPNATYRLILPPILDLSDDEVLRLARWDGSGSTNAPRITTLSDNRTLVEIDSDYGIWKLDFTTDPPRPPRWGSDAPTNGTMIGAWPGDSSALIDSAILATWIDSSVPDWDLNCSYTTTQNGWMINHYRGAGLFATIPSADSSKEIECMITDSEGNSSSRKWTVGAPVLIGNVPSEASKTVFIPISVAYDAPVHEIQVGMSKAGSDAVTIWSDKTLLPSSGSTAVEVDLDSLSPGKYAIWINSEGTSDLAPYSLKTDENILRTNAPPEFVSARGSWEGDILTILVTVQDSEGDEVRITPTVGDRKFTSRIGIDQLSIKIDTRYLDSIDENLTITFDICDAEDTTSCTTATQVFDASHLNSGINADSDGDGISDREEVLAGTDPNDADSKPNQDSIPKPAIASDGEGGLPGFGFFVVIGSIILAATRKRRQISDRKISA